MSELRCTRCLGCFYGICRSCEKPRTNRLCGNCDALPTSEHFCPGQSDGAPHIDVRTQCDCCKTVAFFHQRIATPGIPPLDRSTLVRTGVTDPSGVEEFVTETDGSNSADTVGG